MIHLKEYLYERVKKEIDLWDEKDIYAISFFIYSNEAFTYNEFSNITEFSISYNTEKDCSGADINSEERWNYAFWRQNEINITDSEGQKVLFQWYKENGIDNIGYEDRSNSYDANYKYIGKGPVGYYELLTVVSDVANKLQNENYIVNKFGKPLPIIIHDLEYSWYVIEATKNANPKGEANQFIEVMRALGNI
ncbi:hypothetical protein [Clostridium sp. Marseille-P299]|uniref:hypothetical protein n=1 Tax=Clostridium sp. Marseille-P299 TaxID=1805477 RepID=UPI000830D39B|nr:hypothetical protein [Clostridium sp. Marseille-P299]